MRIYKTSLSAYTEPTPVNRQLYAAAKLPFKRMGQFLYWLAKPWLLALAVTLAAALAIGAYSALATPDGATRQSVVTLGTAAVGWASVLGFPLFVIRLFAKRS